MSDLRKAAEAVLDRWDSPAWEWIKQGPTAELMATLRAALAAPEPERHPGYILGNHWLETAYERLCAGEAEDAILEDYDLVREPRLRELREALPYDWDQLKACRESLREHMAEIKRLREALRTVLDASWNGPLPDYARDEAAAALQEVPR